MTSSTIVSGLIGSLMQKEGSVNPFLAFVLSYLDTLIKMAADAQTSVEGHKMVRVVARLVMDLEWKLRESVNASPSPYDDAILNEFIQACQQIEPGFIPVS